MAEGNKPVGDALAIIESADRRARTEFVQLGAVWLSEKGNLMIHMQAEPLAWRDPLARRTVMVRFRDGVFVGQEARAPRTNNARPNASSAESTSYAPTGGYAPPAQNEEDIPFDAADVPVATVNGEIA